MEILLRGDTIFHVQDLISQDLCRRIIELYERDPRKHAGHTASAGGERQPEADVKVSTDLGIETEGVWQPVFTELHAAVTGVVQSISAQCSALKVAPLMCTGYKIQHYRRNAGHFFWHFDALGPGGWDRQLAVIIYLNSVADGGETAFHRQNLRFKPQAGHALFFPPFWTHMHCGEVPRSADKYIVSSFIRFVLPESAKSAM
ncbi:MAG: 2OG-Fe(II) oxygenase [Gammaproteobacteria bacterium]|nr:2OG-Fe(II) oxygenase [Gammaproteobacteria bacterium]